MCGKKLSSFLLLSRGSAKGQAVSVMTVQPKPTLGLRARRLVTEKSTEQISKYTGDNGRQVS